MWYHTNGSPDGWDAATRHLRRVDRRFGPLIRRAGPCGLSPRRDGFVTLCKAIFNQQISMTVAAVLFARFCDLFPRKRPTPQRVLQVLTENHPAVQRCGLSRQKKAYLLDLARHFADGSVPTRRFAQMSDEQVIESLIRIHGVGRWTAEMFLIFVLARPDVLPVDDLGLRRGIQGFYRLTNLPDARTCRERAEPWRPYRTVATWYLWRGFE